MLWQNFQTAKDVITNIDDSKVKGVRILFCSCSQSSYITEKAVKTFLLEPVDGRNITIKTLVKKNIDKKFIYEFEFKIKTLRNNFSLFIKALCVPNSSDSINGQSIDVTVNKVHFWEIWSSKMIMEVQVNLIYYLMVKLRTMTVQVW